jgi:hypothetical protein
VAIEALGEATLGFSNSDVQCDSSLTSRKPSDQETEREGK